MPKYDPKLLKKISQSQLIAASTEVGIKNAERISKETLVDAFLDKVNKTPEEELTNPAINMYNLIGDLLEPEGAAEPVDESEEVQEEEEVEGAQEEETEKVEEIEEEVREEVEELEEPIKEVKKPMVVKKEAVVDTTAAPSIKKSVALKPTPPRTVTVPAKKAAAPPKKTTRNRFFCAGEAVRFKKYSGTVPALIQLADDIHVKSGGKNNLKEAATVVRASLNLLEGLGVLTVNGDKISPVVAG